jgi:beta-lactamase regulating signal transducer with metallopeptidase domain
MSAIALTILFELGRTTLCLAAAGTCAFLVLRLARVSSPTVHRALWCAALVAGWTFTRLPIDVPWYPAETIVLDDLAPPPPAEIHALELAPEPASVADLPAPPMLPATPPPAIPAVAAQPSFQLPAWPILLLSTWAAGIVALVAVWVIGYARFAWRLRTTAEVDPGWAGDWTAILSAADVRRPIPLRVTRDLGPLLCRLPRGYELLVPQPLWQELTCAERRAILRHELAHFVRGDVWKSLAVRVLALPHWFNPVAWWAVRSIDEAAEWACDAAASDQPTDYAKTLMHLSELVTPRSRYGTAVGRRPLAARIRRLVTLERKEDSTMKRAVLIALAGSLVVAALVRVQLVAEEPETPRARPAAKPPREPEFFAGAVTVSQGEQQMVDAARQAYDVALKWYNAQQTTLDRVYFWSSRWQAAASAVARDSQARTAAAEAHLKRMQDLLKGIAKQYIMGSQGGDALDLAAANFYVAEAKLELAKLELAKVAAARTAPPASQGRPADFRDASAPTFKPPVRSTSHAGPRYKGKHYDEWVDELHNELDPMVRSNALEALGAFAANGLGSQVAAEIMELMHGYRIEAGAINVAVGQDANVPLAAINAFHRIPPEDAVGAVKRALKEGTRNQRMFALSMIAKVAGVGEASSYYLEAVAGDDPDLARTGLHYLALYARGTPEHAEKLREALRRRLQDGTPAERLATIRLIDGPDLTTFDLSPSLSADTRPFPELAGDLLALPTTDDPNLQGAINAALINMGRAIEPALKKAAESKDEGIAARARMVLDHYAHSPPFAYPSAPPGTYPQPVPPVAPPNAVPAAPPQNPYAPTAPVPSGEK